MFCPYCGQQNPDDLQHCQSCSQPLPDISSLPHDYQPPAPRTSKLAIWSLVLSFSAFIIGAPSSIAGLICGIIGINKIGKSAGSLTGKGMAISGVVISAIHLFIVVPLTIAILIPTFMTVKTAVEQNMCAENIKGLSKAMLIYAGDYDEKYPSPNWCNLLIDYADVSEQQFRCFSTKEGPCNYAMNVNIIESGPATPSDIVLLFETTPGWNQIGGPEILSMNNHDNKGCNIVFADGHVRFVEAEDMNSLKWTVE